MWKIKTTAFRLVLVALLATLFGIAVHGDSQAASGINSQISFQGKVVNTNGTNLPDGTYNMQFKIYQDGTGCISSGTAPCGGTLKWTESRLVSASQAVTVTAGTFQVNLGSVTALTGIDFNQDTLWLSMNVGGTATTAVWDGEMTPFIRLTSVPYALNAGMVGGLTASQLVQLTPGTQQSGSINVSGNIQSGGNVTAGASLSVGSATAPSGGVAYLNGNVGIGASSIIGQLQVESATYRSNQLLLNNGVTGTPPAYPGGYLPSLSVISSQTSGSRPLFFGYSNAGAYSSFLTSGACGSFSQMCLDFGTGTTAYTALENQGNVLKVGGGDDGNFSFVNLQGNVGVGNSNSPSLFSVGSSSQFQVSSSGAVTAVGLNGGSGLIQGTGGLTVNGTTTLSAFTTAGILLNNGSGVVSSLADVATGSCLLSAGVGVSPSWGSCGGSSGANVALSNLTGVAINTSLLPGADNAIDLGSSSTSFRSAYIDTATYTPQVDSPSAGGSISVGGSNATTVNIGPTGTTANAAATNIATSTGAVQNVAIGGTGASSGSNAGSTVNLQGGATTLLVANAGVSIQSFTNSTTAFQVANAAGNPIFMVDTTTSLSGNYLTYGGFEVGTTTPTGWASFGAPTSFSRNTAAPNHYGGVASLQLTTAASGQGATTTAFTSVPGNQAYTFSFYAVQTAGTALPANSFSTIVNGGAAVACTAGVTLSSTGFQRVICPIAAPGGNLTSLTIEETAASGSRTFYIDGAQLVAGSNATPATNGAIQLRGAISSPVVFQALSNSTTAFQIQNTAGNANLFVADTLNSRISIGTSGAPAATFSVGGTTGNFQVTSAGVVTGGTYNGATIGATTFNGTTLTGTALTFTGATAINAVNNAVTLSSGTGLLTLGSTSGTILLSAATYTTSTKGVQIGPATAAANPTLLLINQGSTLSETASTCSTSVNAGGMYYNTASGSMRGCINGNWEDMVSTGGLGLLAFGVLPDSANSGNVGEIAGITQTNSPCKVYWSAATQVTVAPCYAYSGGRKVVVSAATNISTAAVAASAYVNVCFGTNGVPALVGTGSTTESAVGQPTWSSNNPLLCLATLQMSTTAGTITGGKIYDTRTFTTTQKTFATSNTAVNNGYVVVQSATANLVDTTATATAGNIRGVVVAYSGAVSTTAANAIIATAGPQYIKATGTTLGQNLASSTTAGYATSIANASTAINYYSLLGIATKTVDTSCTSNTTCQYSQFANPLNIR